MAFVTLPVVAGGPKGDTRINVDHIHLYVPTGGERTDLFMNGGRQVSVTKKVDEIDELIAKATSPHVIKK